MKKFLIVAVSLFVVVAIALTVFVKTYVTQEKVKEYIIPLAESSLNRKVSIGQIDINIFKGIALNEFTIKESDQKTDFVTFKDFVLKFQLLPLLSKKVVIDELKITAPSVRIERDKTGRYNFHDIGKEGVPEKAATGKDGEDGGALPISLLVRKITISDAEFSLTDAKKDLPDFKGTADAAISIKSLSETELATEGRIRIHLDEAVFSGPSPKQIKDITSELEYALRADLQSGVINIEKADITLQEIDASVKGVLKKYKLSPEIDFAVHIPKVKTEKLLEVIAPFVMVDNLNLSGHLSADLQVTGGVKKPETLSASGDVSMDKLRVKYDRIDAVLDGKVKLDKQTMHIDVKGESGRNSARLTGSIRNMFKNQNIDLNVYSEKLYLDEIVPSGEKDDTEKTGAKKTTGERASSEKEAEPLKLKLTANGEIKVDSAEYKGMNMSSFHMTYSFVNNKLNISKMSANAGKGMFSLTSLVDLSMTGYTYDLKAKIDSLHADELVNAFFPKAKDKVFGIMTSNLKLRGKGTLPKNLKKNLVGDADFNVTDGKITGAEIARKLSIFIDLGELETLKFSKAEGTVNINNNIVKLNSIFESDVLKMDPKGNIGLDETINLAFDLKLSPELTNRVRSSLVRKHMKDDGGWGTIPLFVNGTFTDPKYGVDVARVGQKVINKEINKIMDKFLKKEKGTEPQPQKEGEQKQEPVNPLEDMLKQLPGLFSK